MRDQGHILGRLGACYRQLRGADVALAERFLQSGAFDRQRRLQRVDIVRQGGEIGIHDQK